MVILNSKTLIIGGGGHHHTINGKLSIKKEDSDFTEINILSDSELKHQTPKGKFGEHNTLKLEKGFWICGKQVEYNPFTDRNSRVWD